MSECKTVFMDAGAGVVSFQESQKRGEALLLEQFHELFVEAVCARRTAVEAGATKQYDYITVKASSLAMSELGAGALEAAGWRCRITTQRRGDAVHEVDVYVNETLEQYNERQRVSEIADPKPGALAFGTFVRLKHDPARKPLEKVEVGEIGVVTGSDAWSCGTGSSNYVSFPSSKKERYSSRDVSPRDEMLLAYPAQLEVVELARPEVVQPDPAAHRTVAEAVKDEISFSDGREPWRTTR